MNRFLVIGLPIALVAIIGSILFLGLSPQAGERLDTIDDPIGDQNEIPQVVEPVELLQPEPPVGIVEELDPEEDPMDPLEAEPVPEPPQEIEPPPQNVEPPPALEPGPREAPEPEEPGPPGAMDPLPEPEPEPAPVDPEPAPMDEPPPMNEPPAEAPPIEEQGPILEGRVEIVIRDFEFLSNNLTIRKGTEVVWIMQDDMGAGFFHTVTSDEDRSNSRQLFFGDTVSITFDEAGEFRYHCEPHPWMTGTIIVVD